MDRSCQFGASGHVILIAPKFGPRSDTCNFTEVELSLGSRQAAFQAFPITDDHTDLLGELSELLLLTLHDHKPLQSGHPVRHRKHFRLR